MKFWRYLWLDQSLNLRRTELLQKMKSGKIPADLYAVVLPKDECISLEIYPAPVLRQAFYRKEDFTVVGLSDSYDGGKELGASIVAMVFQKTGKTDVNAYLDGNLDFL